MRYIEWVHWIRKGILEEGWMKMWEVRKGKTSGNMNEWFNWKFKLINKFKMC